MARTRHRGALPWAGASASSDAGLVLNWSYRTLGAEVLALGSRSSYAERVIRQPERMVGSVELAAVVCVPRGATELPLRVTGHYMLARGLIWWGRETRVDIASVDWLRVPLPVE